MKKQLPDRQHNFSLGIGFSIAIILLAILKPLWVARFLLVTSCLGITLVICLSGGWLLIVFLEWWKTRSSGLLVAQATSLSCLTLTETARIPVPAISSLQTTSLVPEMSPQLIVPQAEFLPSNFVTASTELIVLKEISKLYGIGDTEVHALRSVNLTINKGEYCAIMGPSGSGKSTAMNMIGCLDRPTSGDYFLDGENVANLSENVLAIVRNRKIGFIFQQFHLLPQLSAIENVMLPMLYAGIPGKERQARANQALEQVGLGHRLQNRPNQLSGGQQQRVAIARAIVNKPVLLLADEPTGALDTHTTNEILGIFRTLHSEGMTVVVVTHEPEVARQTERIVWFRDGQVANDRLKPGDLGSVL